MRAPAHCRPRADLAIVVVRGLVTVLGFVGVTDMLGMSGFADPDTRVA